jgi:tRNA A37 methylthiotransferase MiaB
MADIALEKPQQVCIAYVNGCPRSAMDVALLHDYFKANDYTITRRFQNANLVVCSACGVDVLCEDKSIKYLSIADKKRPKDSQFIVIGCLAGINEEKIRENFDAKLIPPVRLSELDDIIGAKVKITQLRDPNYIKPYMAKSTECFGRFYRFGTPQEFCRALVRKAVTVSGLRRILVALSLIRNVRHSLEPVDKPYCLRIAHGCMGQCSYCAIRFAAGPLRSKSMDDILEEFDRGLNQGFTEFSLIAGDVGAYGQDIGSNIAELLRKILSRKGNYKITLFDFGPQWFIQYASELIRLLASNKKRISMLMLPVQSGSDRILSLMRRDYKASEIIQAVKQLLKAYPQVLLSTHVLVGFPGETEEDFQMTVELLRTLRFQRVDIYEYSERPKIGSLNLPNQVPQEEIKRRATTLHKEFD